MGQVGSSGSKHVTLPYAHKFADNGASYLEEPPETPAPLFAVRAFKTAIFGTPHPYQREVKRPVQPKTEDRNTKLNAPVVKPKSNHAFEGSDGINSDPVRDADKPAVPDKLDPLASPAKGILLTPGTATTRRKTVSFGNMDSKHWGEAEQPMNSTAEAKTDLPLTSNELGYDTAPEGNPRHSTLTRTLIELSKKKPAKVQSSAGTDLQEKSGRQAFSMDFCTDSILGSNADVTVDLSQPRSRSEQHWKARYDQYHKRSHREMKKMIKYGQNVKSYAVKKDTEATSLSERLNRELAKVAALETKVSNLATQLDSAQLEGPNEENGHGRLVSELAQQTAMTIKHKQRADGLKTALQRQGSSEAFEEPQGNPVAEAKSDAPSEVVSICAELESLRATASAAENQAIKFEKENAALKRSLARVKEEMMSYETRRQAREERLKKREAKHKAAREECEKRLAQLTIEHEELLRTSGELPVVDMMAEIQSIQKDAGMQDFFEGHTETDRIPTSDKGNARPFRIDEQAKSPYISPRKRRLQKPVVDIWSLSSPREDENQAPPSKEPTVLAPSSVKHDIQRTLKEIDQNLVPKQVPETTQHLDLKPTKPNISSRMPPPPLPQLSNTMASATRRMHNRRTTITSPRPSMINVASSPAKLPEPSHPTQIDNEALKPSVASMGRSASLKSRAGSRTNTMGSGRVSSMSLERAEAAKARLARRSAEKRTKQGGER